MSYQWDGKPPPKIDGMHSNLKMDETNPISPELTRNIFKSVVEATKTANDLPKLGDNYELYASFPAFAELMKTEGERTLNLYVRIFELLHKILKIRIGLDFFVL